MSDSAPTTTRSPQTVQAHTPTSSSGGSHLAGVAVRAYRAHSREVDEDRLILEFLPLVHKIVSQVVSYLRPPLSRDDLVSAGTIGLVKAARDYDPTNRAEFKTYAYIRVRGAVIDELRGWSFAPASLKKRVDRAQQVLRQMIEEDGVTPTDAQLADRLEMSVDKMYRMFENARARHFLSLQGGSDDTPALGETLTAQGIDQPGDNIERQELSLKLAEAITTLPDKQRKIILLYYTRELTMKQVAEVLSVTESRVSQLHASALFTLSTRLKQWDDSRQ